jgi:teichoic acid transport system permease protein
MVGFSLIFSSLNVIFKDFQKFLQPVLRLLMYISAVIVPLENYPEATQRIFRLNPLTYVVEGYRNCLIYNTGILPHWERATYFWVFSIFMYVLGCCIHMKLRKQFIDLV